jgi:phage protein D/phage baseplate assembly protein gpV
VPDQLTAASFHVEIDGRALPAEIELSEAVVEDNLHRPDSFSLELRDIDRGLVDRLGLRIGAKVTIGVVGDVYTSPEPLLEGEVTALEAEVDVGTNLTVLRGYDQSHRLFRGRMTTSYQAVAASDVAQRVARRAGLATGEIQATSVVHDHIGQSNQNDWDFLGGLARVVGYEVAVSDGKLHFRPPKQASAAPGDGNLTQEDPLKLLLGSNLLRLRSSITSAGQVPEVEARGWDFMAKRSLSSKAAAKTVAAEAGVKPADLARTFSAPPLVTSFPPMSRQPDVEARASAVAEEVASSFAELEGVARGNPKLKAGTAVHLGLVGQPFDGKYVLTGCRHRYDRYEGYTTSFTVSGRNDRSLLALTGTGSGDAPEGVDGAVIGLVDDVADPEGQCRVRLRFPSLSEDYVSDWARTVQAGAGAKRGLVVVPEVGDEVLVAFDQGDVRRPYVLGGLYNGKDAPDLGRFGLLDSGKHSVDTRRFVSRKGHSITFSDADGKEKVVISSSDGKLLVELDIASSTIRVTSGGKVEVSADTDATIEAKGRLTLKGNQVQVEAQSQLGVKGSMVSLEAQANLEAKASGNVSVRGALIQLN